jgi:hypothetical protein
MIDWQFSFKKIGILLSKKVLITNYWNFAQSLKRKLHIRTLRKDKIQKKTYILKYLPLKLAKFSICKETESEFDDHVSRYSKIMLKIL